MADSTHVTTVDLETALLAWVPQQRWFAAKGSRLVSLDVVLRVPIGEVSDRGSAQAEHVLVDIGLDSPVAEGGRVQRYQIPLGFRNAALDDDAANEDLTEWRLPAPFSGDAEVIVYDGLRDPVIIGMYGDALAAAESEGPIAFRNVDGKSVDSGLRGRVLGAEQSNTSVVLGEVLLLKLFRRISPGVNPDIELHRALAETGCPNVASLQGWIDTEFDGESTMLGMVQDFVPDAAEGWSTALASVRDVLAGTTEAPDFAREAYELGAAVAHVHADLARVLGTSDRPASTSVDEILGRIEEAAREVPALAGHLPAARALIAKAEAAGMTTVQRIHGDLHLGQVLRTPTTWLLIDFEGEPAKSIDERRRPDSVLRDVAGMLRSFDYAAHHLLLGDPDITEQTYQRASSWAERNSDAFCDGYASVSGADPRAQAALVGAYELDKAVYEAVYESRNRPTWLAIPMRAIARLAPLRA